MNQLAINVLGEELENAARFCSENKVGLEFTDFAFPDILDEDLTQRIERHRVACENIEPLVAHGPFFDLVVTSLDKQIVNVAQARHSKALEAIGKTGAEYYISHTNYTPLIKDPGFFEEWIERSLDFWLPLADRAAELGIVISLENIWEPTPEIQAELISKGNHPNLRATLDVGHTLVFSKIASSEWVKTLGGLLAHCHLHDNYGQEDEHNPVGEGIENWEALADAIKQYAPTVVLVAESDRLDQNQKSLEKMLTLFGD